MLTFTPPRDPVATSESTFTAVVLIANFGDGYEQTAAQGLNSVSGTYTITWEFLSSTDRDTIEAFFVSQLGGQAFLYTFPTESTPKKFKCKTWTRSTNGALWTIKAEFRQVFDLS